jgi:hypothetical protein
MSPAQWNARAAPGQLCLSPGRAEWPHRLAQIPSKNFPEGMCGCTRPFRDLSLNHDQ